MDAPVSPKPKMIYLIALVLGVGIACWYHFPDWFD